MRLTDVVSDPVLQRETVGLADRVIDTVPVTVEGLFEAIDGVALRLFVFSPEGLAYDGEPV